MKKRGARKNHRLKIPRSNLPFQHQQLQAQNPPTPALIKNKQALQALARELVAEEKARTHVQFLSDEEAVAWLIQRHAYDEASARALIAKWRKLAAELGWTGPVAWKVRAGFTLTQHAPKVGPCYKQFKYLQDSNFQDESTKNAIVFWVPVIISGTRDQNTDEQRVVLANVRCAFELPKHHLSCFGNAALLAALILAEFKRSGKRLPANKDWVRTDTRNSAGNLLNLGCFGDDGLSCGDVLDSDRLSILGAFALGVELEA